MPLQSNVLVSAYAIGLDGTEREPASGVMNVPEEEAPPSGVTAIELLPEDAILPDDDATSGILPVVEATPLPPPPPTPVDVSVVPPGPPPVDDDEERPSQVIARIAITRMSAMAIPATATSNEVRGVELALTGAPASHVTIQLLDGTVLHEGAMGADGRLAVRVLVPRGHGEIRAMMELGSKHRTALVPIAEGGRTEYTFR